MEENNINENKPYIIYKYNKKIFVIIREKIEEEKKFDFNFSKEDIDNNIITLVIDVDNLSIEYDHDSLPKIGNIMDNIFSQEKIKVPLNLIIKNTLTDSSNNIYSHEVIINELNVSDELYRMTPKLSNLFQNINSKKLVLKKIKINSKNQLFNVFDFILQINCEELILEDVFIDLIIKEEKEEKEEKEDDYNILNKYFFYKNNKIYIKNLQIDEKETETEIKKIKMVDCPLFAITEGTFIGINKDISIDIDENSLLNPSMITKFIINGQFLNIYFDLDSYKLNNEKDYTEYLNELFNKLFEIKHLFNKLVFKNFDTTKYEYITGDNLTFIDEKNWVLNEQEKKRKKKFEEFDKIINELINKNINKLSNVKELVFDNCTNHFIELILKFINSSKNDLDILKIKKCGKEYFDLKNILSLNIKNLILFDTPLIIDYSNKEKTSTNLERFKGDLGKIENLTIKINCLEHYCLDNNLDYYNTIEIIKELIEHKNIGKNLYFEMKALPIIMTYLAAKKYYEIEKIKEKFSIPTDFNFKSVDKRREFIVKIKGLENKGIIIKNNHIKNKLDNFYYMSLLSKKELFRIQKSDYGNELFDIDKDYKTFFEVNNINTIILKNSMLTNFNNSKIKDEKNNLTIINLMQDSNKNYKIDIKTLNEILYKNINIDDFTHLFYIYNDIIEINDKKELNSEEYSNLGLFKNFNDNLKSIFKEVPQFSNESLTIMFNNIKERKEFFCLLMYLREINKDGNTEEINFKYRERPIKFIFSDKEHIIKKKLDKYFLKEMNEEKKEKYSAFNYYYTSKEEIELFGEPGSERDEAKRKTVINFDKYRFKVEYTCYNQNKNNEEETKGDEFWDYLFK